MPGIHKIHTTGPHITTGPTTPPTAPTTSETNGALPLKSKPISPDDVLTKQTEKMNAMFAANKSTGHVIAKSGQFEDGFDAVTDPKALVVQVAQLLTQSYDAEIKTVSEEKHDLDIQPAIWVLKPNDPNPAKVHHKLGVVSRFIAEQGMQLVATSPKLYKELAMSMHDVSNAIGNASELAIFEARAANVQTAGLQPPATGDVAAFIFVSTKTGRYMTFYVSEGALPTKPTDPTPTDPTPTDPTPTDPTPTPVSEPSPAVTKVLEDPSNRMLVTMLAGFIAPGTTNEAFAESLTTPEGQKAAEDTISKLVLSAPAVAVAVTNALSVILTALKAATPPPPAPVPVEPAPAPVPSNA